MNWDNVNAWSDDKWDHAYLLFLRNSPLRTLISELNYVTHLNRWDDNGFNIDTTFPRFCSYHDNVDKRAILLVISRNKKMDSCNWDNLSSETGIIQFLTIQDKLLINSITHQIYGVSH